MRKKQEGMRKFTRRDIEDRVYDKLIGRKLTKKLLADSLIETLRELLLEADPLVKIEIRDFGVFEIKKSKPKPKARNIRTGEFVYVPGRRKIHFKPGKLIKEFLKKEI